MKKTLLVVIDGLCSRVVRSALQAGRLPHLQQLAAAGAVDWESVSIFPSITPAATSSICTGAYPASHGITGAHFLDRDEDRIHYYGSDFWVVLDRGAANFVNDMLMSMNHNRLRSETLFEIIENTGREAASLNFLIFRGRCEHAGRVPWILRMWPGVPWTADLHGPNVLCLGDFVRERLGAEESRQLHSTGGPRHRFGFNDQATGELLLELADQGLPDFTLAYFPDNDFQSHAQGPAAALECVERVDSILGKLCENMGGLEALLAQLAIVVTGDHGHDDIDDDLEAAKIDLADQLGEFSLAGSGSAWDDDDELMVCPNLRAAQLYVRSTALPRWDELVDRLLTHNGIDQVIWQEGDEQGAVTYFHIATSDRGRLDIATHDQVAETTTSWRTAVDDYGQRWRYRGELGVVDADVEEDRLVYGDYPNALERIVLAFEPRMSGDLWLTARPGREFFCPGNVIHPGGGSHGSLHASDSLSPLITAGLPPGVAPPRKPRLVDLAPLVLACLGVESSLVCDQGHVETPAPENVY